MLQRLLFIYLLLLNDLNLFCFMLYEGQIKMPWNKKKKPKSYTFATFKMYFMHRLYCFTVSGPDFSRNTQKY